MFFHKKAVFKKQKHIQKIKIKQKVFYRVVRTLRDQFVYVIKDFRFVSVCYIQSY